MTGALWGALVLVAWGFLAASAWGAGPVYGTWDRFFYKVQMPVRAAEPATTVTLLVYHSYPGPLHDVRISGRSDTLTVTRQPAVRKSVSPTEIVSVPIAVARTEKATGQTAVLQVSLRAAELPEAKTILVTVPLTAQAERDLEEQSSIPVGAMEVRIGGLGNQMYLLYLGLALALIGWMLWRRRQLARR